MQKELCMIFFCLKFCSPSLLAITLPRIPAYNCILSKKKVADNKFIYTFTLYYISSTLDALYGSPKKRNRSPI